MAFPSAAGYTNLPNGNFTPQIYSQKVLKFFRKASVVEAITNTDYEGEIANMGDTVHILKEPTITVTPYARGAQVVPQDLVDNELTLVIDHANAFSFKVDDIEAKQSHVNWEDLATSSGAYSLSNAYDTELLNYIYTNVPAGTTTGTTGAPISVGYSAGALSPLNVLNVMGRQLNQNNVPLENRWVVAGPLFWERVMDENSKLIGTDFASTQGDESQLVNGMVTVNKLRGFKCYTSNNLPAAGSYYPVISGHMSAVCTANSIVKQEMFRDPGSFADVFRGLHVYGRQVLRTESLAAYIYNPV